MSLKNSGFVNGKSGANQGKAVVSSLKSILHPDQVFDLSSAGCNPVRILDMFVCLPGLRVLVAGGDGTVNWILDSMMHLAPEQRPPVAVLPLGTGNDMARVLGWGHTTSVEAVPDLLYHIMRHASTTHLDRWQMTCATEDGSGKKKEGGRKVLFSNYLGVGVDAAIVTAFHHARQTNPARFMWQVFLSGRQMRGRWACLSPGCFWVVLVAAVITIASSIHTFVAFCCFCEWVPVG